MGWRSDPATVALLLATASFSLSGMLLLAAQAATRTVFGLRTWSLGCLLHGLGWGMLWQAYAWGGPALSPLPEICFVATSLAFFQGLREVSGNGKDRHLLWALAAGSLVPLYAFCVFPGFAFARIAVVTACGAVLCFLGAHQTTYRLRVQPRDVARAISILFLLGGVTLSLWTVLPLVPALPWSTHWSANALKSASLTALFVGLLVQTMALVFLESTLAQTELHRLAALDPLTEVFNRRMFMTLADREIERARRNNSPLSLITFDLDHFKQFNDSWGHAAGDAVLRATVAAVSAGLRAQDLLGRVGGEEFSILVPGATLDNSYRIAERVRAAILQSPITFNGRELPFSISLGVAQWVPGEGLAQLASRADQALYQAKHLGRNRVEAISSINQRPVSVAAESLAPTEAPSMAHWRVDMATGDAVVDAQHEQLFTLVRSLRASIAAGNSSDIHLGDLMKELQRYTRDHFQAEEALMERSGYPGLEMHRSLHNEVVKQTTDLVTSWHGGGNVLAITLSQFLSHWLVRHVQEEDMPMIRWIQQRPIPAESTDRMRSIGPKSLRFRRSG